MIRVCVPSTARSRPLRLTKKRHHRTGEEGRAHSAVDDPGMAGNDLAATAAAVSACVAPEHGVVAEPRGPNGCDHHKEGTSCGAPTPIEQASAGFGAEVEDGGDRRSSPPLRAAGAENGGSLPQFLELVSSEVAVDLDKLRDAARRGVPDQIRPEVWKYLLGVFPADRSKESSTTKANADEYEQIEKETNLETAKLIRGEASRYIRRVGVFNDNTSALAIFERVIGAYLNHNKEADYHSGLVHLCGPFVFALQNEPDVFYCFEQLMSLLEEYYVRHSLQERVATFSTLFRSVLPDLYNYFEDEEVDINEWASAWLQNLLATALPLPCLLRLWDAYFSLPDGLELHVYVCLAILRHCKDSLEELEQSEIRTLLLRLPPMDMEQVLNLASNIQCGAYESDR